MKLIARVVALFAGCIAAYGNEGFLPPWEEFKNLYRQSIEQEFNQKATTTSSVSQVYSIDVAEYTLVINGDGVWGEVAISGTVLEGGPEPISLFGNEMAIIEVKELEGGSFHHAQDSELLSFLPEAETKEFCATVTFLLTLQEESGVQVLSLAIPPAVRNSLQLTLPEEASLAESPGIADTKGIYHFSARSKLLVKYFKKKQLFVAPPAVIELDSINCIRVEENRLLVSVHYQPMRPAPESLALHAPPGAQIISSSLKASQLNKTAEDQYIITFPESEQNSFSIDFALDDRVDGGEISLMLPFVENNTGAENRFVVEEPDEGQINVEAQGLSASVPVEKLGGALAANVRRSLSYRKVPPETPIQIAYTSYQTVSTPATVLNSQSLFISFAENGAVLSVLRLEVPPETGTRMKIKAIKDMDVWSLKVNNVNQSIHTDADNNWIIPLDGAQSSQVELALLRHGPKLALQGVLEATMPETGLPSRELCVGIALPPRVDLLSLEGSVSPASGEQWQPPAEFVGKPHFFSQSFYKGEGMTLSIAYKEPINQNL